MFFTKSTINYENNVGSFGTVQCNLLADTNPINPVQPLVSFQRSILALQALLHFRVQGQAVKPLRTNGVHKNA